jgi:hypothetical protein
MGSSLAHHLLHPPDELVGVVFLPTHSVLVGGGASKGMSVPNSGALAASFMSRAVLQGGETCYNQA